MSLKLTSPLKALLRISTIHNINRHSFASCGRYMGDPCKPQGRLKPKFRSMWYHPKCCNQPCKDVEPRLDRLYYKPSNKFRKFQQTWCERGELRVVKKKLCCSDRIAVEPMERRDRHVPHGRDISFADKIEAMCRIHGDGPCPKMKPHRCRPGRDPPKCQKLKSPQNCLKVTAPYPSYSECKHPKPRVRLPTECTCLHVRPFCPFGNEKKSID